MIYSCESIHHDMFYAQVFSIGQIPGKMSTNAFNLWGQCAAFRLGKTRITLIILVDLVVFFSQITFIRTSLKRASLRGLNWFLIAVGQA